MKITLRDGTNKPPVTLEVDSDTVESVVLWNGHVYFNNEPDYPSEYTKCDISNLGTAHGRMTNKHFLHEHIVDAEATLITGGK